MTLARRAQIELTWQTVDITRDIAPDLLGLTYVDNLSGSADDLSIELQDRGGKWASDWKPTFGDTVTARLRAEPWLTTVSDVRLGSFAHDKISLTGPPKKVSLKAVSAPLATGLRRRKRTRGWKGVTLRQIAEDITQRAGLELFYDAASGRAYRRVEQHNESDLEFLMERCKEQGHALKVTEGKIAIFDEAEREKAEPVGTIDLSGGHVISWNFDADDSDRYGAVHIVYFDPRSGKKVEASVKDPENPDGQTLELTYGADTGGTAGDRAKAFLRAANRFANAGKLTVPGDPGLVAGVTFDLAGGGGFDGRFIVTRAEHHAVGGGYTCTLDVRRTLEGY